VSARATQSTLAIGQLMPNIGGHSTFKKMLLGMIVSSKLLYASSSWEEVATHTGKNREAIKKLKNHKSY
jgi:hypothetical protein